jgi:sialate O-acetylesterase
MADMRWKGIITLVVTMSSLSMEIDSYADVKIPSIFSDHMVLQRNMKIPVWGWARPGENVSVYFAGRQSETLTDKDGNWSLVLDPVVCDEPMTMTIKGQNVIEIKDILMGEVWVCSGQSNMGFRVEEDDLADQETPLANYPEIRHFQIQNKVCPEPDRTLGGAWNVCSPETVGKFTAVGYFFAKDLHKRLKVPIGLVHTSWGGTPAEAWISRDALQRNPKLHSVLERFETACKKYPDALKIYEEEVKVWEKKSKEAEKNGLAPPSPPRTPMGPTHFQRPSGMYNGMVLSIVPYAVRGALWYQGECNSEIGFLYSHYLSTLITNWREIWGQGEFPFYIVQIANFGTAQTNPNEISSAADLRGAQSQVAKSFRNCGLAVTIDIGETKSLNDHPTNKHDIGLRLAKLAAYDTYGLKDVTPCGPTFKTMSVENSFIRIEFDYAEGGLNGGTKGFAVAGSDLNFKWADVRIKGNSVMLSSPEVSKPTAVRYNWGNNPQGNLQNKAGLPAVPFYSLSPNLKILDAVEDTFIDRQYPDKNYGQDTNLRIEDDGKFKRWALIKWDISEFDQKARIEDVTFKACQTDGNVGDGVDVFGIESGDWKENDITWNRWNALQPKLVFLGTMKVTEYPDGISLFTSPMLVDWVQGWVSGKIKNHGLMLKYHYIKNYTGDSFQSHDDERLYNYFPRLIVNCEQPHPKRNEKKDLVEIKR